MARHDSVETLFASPTGEWQRVSPALATIHRISMTVPAIVLALVALVVTALVPDLRWIPGIVAVLLIAEAVFSFIWAGRTQRAWGYAENEQDLLVTSGVMFRRLVAVPYGRMQFVDVQAGPLQRAFGVATVTLHTASSETTSDIPGLPADEATRLRNRLTELGESRGAGV
ncbi:PH domain-containing protein [Aeromicrobium sp. CF3.5]|uniref:PH domain-containing protein n=1 Tax=Aeromicrobium sp. CF3.5 TaxID=3373078 RepID=UPI003EE6192E